MRVVFRFGVYIVTKSVMGLWWFRWIVFSLSCIGLATSLTSSKSFCINYFYFRTKLCCCDFCKCFYKITSKSFLFSSDWLIRGRNANTWDSLLYYNCFLGNQKKLLEIGVFFGNLSNWILLDIATQSCIVRRLLVFANDGRCSIRVSVKCIDNGNIQPCFL